VFLYKVSYKLGYRWPIGSHILATQLVLVCDSKTGSSTLTLIAHTIEVRISEGSKSL
jgi:hypothetical protein